MSRSELAAYLLVAAVAAGLAWGGATTLVGLLACCAAAVCAVVLAGDAGGAGSGGGGRLPARTAAGLAVVVCWLLVSGIARDGVDVDTVRVPVLLLTGAAAVLAVRRLPPPARELALRGLLLAGVLHATVALGQAAAVLPGTDPALRAAGLVGHPNVLGILLVATGLLTARELVRRGSPWLRSPWLVSALVVQAGALLLTGSRLALAVAAVGVLVAVRRRPWLGLPGLGFLAVGTAVLVIRSGQRPLERPRLWRVAAADIAERPWFGWGARPRLLTDELPGVRPTTHAHDEVLQLALEHGLVGLAVVVSGLALWLRGQRVVDGWLVAAALCLVLAGLGDIGLRFPPVVLVLGMLLGAGTAPRGAVGPGRSLTAEEGVATVPS